MTEIMSTSLDTLSRKHWPSEHLRQTSRELTKRSDAERLPEYSVKCIEIKRIRNTGVVKAKLLGPTTFVAILGFILSMGLLGFSLWQQDGMGMLAVLCLSFLSTLIGVGNKWTLNLPTRRNAGQFTPKGDVVIRYPKGNFVVVRCTEDVARELFFAPETIEYLVEHPWKYRMIALVGTIILMFGVIFLGNSGTYVQVTFAGAFMVLNAGYWIVAALPQRYHWDTRCFEVIPQAFDEPAQPPVKEIYDSKTDHCKLDDKDIDSKKAPKLRVSKSLPIKRKPWVSYNKTFTQALWKVIVATQDIEWARRSKTAPATDAWDEWLHEALAQASCMPPEPKLQKQLDGSTVAFYQMPEWNAQKALSQCLQAHANDTEKGNKRFDRNSADTANTMAGAEAGVEAKDQAHSTSLEV
jgi:hypothetical protein